MTPGVVLGRISNLKNESILPEAFRPHSYTEELVSNVYPVYQDLLRQNNAFDFDYLIAETVHLLKLYFRRHWSAIPDRHSHILVDEYQDTNHAQDVLVSML